METIIKKISLEPYITRFPVCWPALSGGTNYDTNTSDVVVHYVDGDCPMANYGQIPLGVCVSKTVTGETIHYDIVFHDPENEVEGEDEMVLPYQTLQRWFLEMLAYRRVLYSESCHGPFSSMVEYYTAIFKEKDNLSAMALDVLYKEHGGNEFYDWLTGNYFVMLNLEEEYYNNGSVSGMTRQEWDDILLNIGTSYMTYPEVVSFLGKMTEWKSKINPDNNCGESQDCCRCIDYKSCGGDLVKGMLEDWLRKINGNISNNNQKLKIDTKIQNLYPEVDICLSLKNKIEDFGVMESCATDFVPGRRYITKDICIAEDDVWILSGNTSYCEESFDASKGWGRYLDWYNSEHSNNNDNETETTLIYSGRTTSSLDLFIRQDALVDGRGHTLPGYFEPNKVSLFPQPGENTLLDLLYKPGTCVNVSLVTDNGSDTSNEFTGDVLSSITVYYKDEHDNIRGTTVFNERNNYDMVKTIFDIENSDTYQSSSTHILYADFTYYKDLSFKYVNGSTQTDNNRLYISGDVGTAIEYVDHCRLELSTCRYYLSKKEVYPLRYYKVVKDIESVYSDEQRDTVNVAMCDFKFRPAKFKSPPIVMSPVFRKEELLGFSMQENPVNNIYINRGYATVLDRHLRIGEICNYEQLQKYGNGIFTIFNTDEDVV